MDILEGLVEEGEVNDEGDEMRRITEENPATQKIDAKSWVSDIVTFEKEIDDEDDDNKRRRRGHAFSFIQLLQDFWLASADAKISSLEGAISKMK